VTYLPFLVVFVVGFAVPPPAPLSELPVFVVGFAVPPPAPLSELPVFVVGFAVPPPAPLSELPTLDVVAVDLFFVNADSEASFPPKPATTTDNVSPSVNMTIALVAFNFFILIQSFRPSYLALKTLVIFTEKATNLLKKLQFKQLVHNLFTFAIPRIQRRQ
jgi:hypothetical protein